MGADSAKNKRTLLVLGYMGQFCFYGGTVVMIVGTILARMGIMDDDAPRVAVFLVLFGFTLAWGAGNNRAITELQERVAALEERDRNG